MTDIENIDREMAQVFEERFNRMEKNSIKEVHDLFFKDIDLVDFEEKLSKLNDDKKYSFIDACLFLKESASIETQISAVRYLLLFTSVEALMGEKYKPFEQWLITNKEVKGNDEKEQMLSKMRIENRGEFTNLIKKLSEVYHKYYGVNESVRKFFDDYIDLEDKKKIIKSLLVKNGDTNRSLHICYISDDVCYKYGGGDKYRCLYLSAKDCIFRLNNEESINKAMRKTISIFYDFFRNKISHSGVRCNTVSDNATLFADYNGKRIEIEISFNELREIIVKGIQRYYKNIDQHTKNNY